MVPIQNYWCFKPVFLLEISHFLDRELKAFSETIKDITWKRLKGEY